MTLSVACDGKSTTTAPRSRLRRAPKAILISPWSRSVLVLRLEVELGVGVAVPAEILAAEVGVSALLGVVLGTPVAVMLRVAVEGGAFVPVAEFVAL